MQRRKLIKSTLPQRAAQSGARLTDLTQQNYQATPGTQPGLPEAYANAWSRGLFAPGAPVTPLITDDEQPRIFDYASGINLYFTPRGGYDLLPFSTLRQFAKLCEEINIVKEAIKRETRALDWDIVPIDDKDNTDYSNEIARLRAWWESPDGLNGFDQWQNMLLEEMLVLDAAAIWFGSNGKRDVAYIFDGSIIRPLLDERGMTPEPPVPAYVSYIKGRNWQWFTSERLLYRPFNTAANSPYGMSPTEFFVLRVNEAIRRKMSAASYWDSTNIPEMLAGLPETWTTQQIEEFQDYWDALLTGDIDKLRRMKFLPAKAGTLPVYEVRRPAENSQADEWMLRLACWCFGILPAEIGLVTGSKGLGGKGFLEGQENAEFRFGFGPVVKYLQALYTQMTRRLTNQPLKWTFTDIGPQEDRTADFQLQQTKLFTGAIDINVIRQAEGQEPIPNAQPFIVVGNQVTLLKDLFNPKPPPPAQPNPFGNPAAPEQTGQTPEKAAEPAPGEQPPEVMKVAMGEWREKVKRRMADGKPALCDPPQLVKALIPQATIDHVRHHLTNDANALGVFGEPFLAKAAGAKHATAQRDQIEEELRQSLSDTLNGLIDDSYDPKTIGTAGSGFWETFKQTIIDALTTILINAYLVGVEEAHTNPMFQPAVSVSVDWTLVNNSAVQAAREYTVQLSGELTQNTIERVSQAVADWIQQGGALPDLADAINEVIDDPKRAQLIAQTESTRAFASGNKTAWQTAGVGKFSFHTVEDSRVCPICETYDGQVYSMSDTEHTPPIHPGCLTGDALITPIGGVSAVSERHYDGDLIVINTASGKNLTCTPNHPILTDRGWFPAGVLDKGRHVIACRFREGKIFGDIYNEYVPSSFKDIAEAFRRSLHVYATPVKVTAPDFHGDGIGSDIAVVYSNRLLWDNLDPMFYQHVAQSNLVGRPVTHAFFDSLGISNSLGIRSFSPPGSIVRGFDLSHAGVQRHSAPLQGFGLGLIADVNSTFDETFADSPSVDVALMREFILRFTSGIFADEVIEVDRYPFFGHVYNLQSESGSYIANGIITHNCRCYLQPMTESKENGE